MMNRRQILASAAAAPVAAVLPWSGGVGVRASHSVGQDYTALSVFDIEIETSEGRRLLDPDEYSVEGGMVRVCLKTAPDGLFTIAAKTRG